MNMPLDDFLLEVYVVVDDWYKAKGRALLCGKTGPTPAFGDSEVLTLALARPFVGFTRERAWVRFVRNNLRSLFPAMLSQSEYNRRVRGLCRLLEELRRFFLCQLEVSRDTVRIVDSAPIHVRHWRRHGKGHLDLEGATLGFCAAKQMVFYGYRLIVLIAFGGIPTDRELIPANADEREGARDLLEDYRDLTVLGDKGLLSRPWEEQLKECRNITLLTPKRRNQKVQNPAWLNKMICSVRERVETTFSQLCEQFGMEHPGARSVWGIWTRLAACIAAMTLGAFLNTRAGHPPMHLANLAL